MSVARRLAKLEQQQVGDDGAGVWGVCSVHYLTQTGPDVVTVGPTGEQLTKTAFHARYPRGLLIVRTEYSNTVELDVAINDFIEDRDFGQDAR